MSFAAPDEVITNFTPANQESLLLRPVKIELGPTPRLLDLMVDSLENKPASLPDWQSTAALSVVEDQALKRGRMKMLSKHKNSRSRRLGTFKATRYTIDMKE